MMLRLVDSAFVRRIGAEQPQSLNIALEDRILPGNNGVFAGSFSEEGSRLYLLVASEPELRVSIADLGSFLFGMLGAEELPGLRKTAAFRSWSRCAW